MAKYKIIPSSRTIMQSPISIGHKAEKGVEAIEFDLTAWVETYGSGTLTVIMRRWGDAIPYPIALEIDENNKATWTLSDIDTAKAGMAYAQLNYIVGDEVVKKSDIYTFRVMDSLTGEGEPPEAYESWLEHLTHLAAEAMAEVLDIEGIVTDKTLTVDGGIADGKATGDALALKADKSTTYTKAEVDQMIEDVEVETDTTLSVSGAPADSKATGDALSALEDAVTEETDKLKADLGDVTKSLDSVLYERTEAWQKKTINSSTGDLSSSENRIATPNYIDSSIINLEGSADAKYAVYVYDDEDTYLGIWNGTEIKKQAGWLTGSNSIAPVRQYNIKLLLARNDNASITTDFSTNLTMLGALDVDSYVSISCMPRRLLTNGDDLDSIKQIGVYNCASASLPNNVPESVGGLLVVSAVNNIAVQNYYTTTSQYFRFKNSSNLWYSWQKVTRKTDLDVVQNEANKIPMIVRTMDLLVESDHANAVTVSFSYLNLQYRRGTAFEVSEDTSCVLNDSNPLLCVKNNELRVLNYGGVDATTIVLLQIRFGSVVGGILYPAYIDCVRKFNFINDSELNVNKKSKQLGNLKWTPKASVLSGEGVNEAGVEVTGVPYSSVKEYLKFVGIDVSIHTFMTAVNDIHSLLYTERVGETNSRSSYGITYNGVNSASYFGTVCSGLTATALGRKVRYDSWQYQSLTDIFDVIESQDVRNLEVGDVLSEPGHCSIIANVIRHPDGSAKTLTLHEHIAPITFHNYTPLNLNNRTIFRGGVWCRCKKIDKNTEYKASPFVRIGMEFLYNIGDLVYIDGDASRTFYSCKTANSDSEFTAAKWNTVSAWAANTNYNKNTERYIQYGENVYRCLVDHNSGSAFDPTKWERQRGIVEWAAYPYIYNDDIVTFAGDRAVFHSNDLICIDYVKGDYTSMQIYKDGTLTHTLTLPSSGYQIDVSSYCSEYGMYKVRLTDGTNYSRYTYFEVLDTTVSATYSDGLATVDFSSANGKPLEIQICELSGFPICHVYLTDKDIAAGQVVLTPNAKMFTERYWYMERYEDYSETVYARVVFEGEYGNTVNPMVELGTMTPVHGEIVYHNKPLDLGTITTATNIILADKVDGKRYSVSFTAGDGVSVTVIPVIGTIRWKNALPVSLVNGTTYLITVENGIGDVVSLSQ